MKLLSETLQTGGGATLAAQDGDRSLIGSEHDDDSNPSEYSHVGVKTNKLRTYAHDASVCSGGIGEIVACIFLDSPIVLLTHGSA